MIYVIGILENRYVKIGFCKDESPDKRIAALQTGNPFELQLIACVPGTLRQEQSLHAALNEAFGRSGIAVPPNEWYPGNNKFMKVIIEAVKFGPNYAISVADEYVPSRLRHGKEGTKSNWPEISKNLLRKSKRGKAMSFKKTKDQIERKSDLPNGRVEKRRRRQMVA